MWPLEGSREATAAVRPERAPRPGECAGGQGLGAEAGLAEVWAQRPGNASASPLQSGMLGADGPP